MWTKPENSDLNLEPRTLSSKALILSGIPLSSTSLFRLACLVALFDGLDRFFLACAAAFRSKSRMLLVSNPSRCFVRICSWFCSLSLRQQPPCISTSFRQLLSLCCRTGHLVHLPSAVLLRRPREELWFNWSSGLRRTGVILSIRENTRLRFGGSPSS